MEIKVRQIDEKLIKEMDSISKRQGISRSEFLRRILTKEVTLLSQSNALDNKNRVRFLLTQHLIANNDLLPILIEYLEELNG